MNHRALPIPVLLVLLAAGCGDGGGRGDDQAPASERLPNPNIPVEFIGTTAEDTRFYRRPAGSHRVSVLPTGLVGKMVVSLDGELLTLDGDEAFFNRSFAAGDSVSVAIESQPFLQTCTFGTDTGTVMADATLQLPLGCLIDLSPAPPFIALISSPAADTIDIAWEDSVDRDSAPSDFSYRVYYSTDETQVENRTAAFVDVAAGTRNAQITNLQAGAEYFIAVEGTDTDSTASRSTINGTSAAGRLSAAPPRFFTLSGDGR